jgi:hypothetical protein
MNTDKDNELKGARDGYRHFMAERITDNKQFGHEINFQRSELYAQLQSGALAQAALFGLFLGGFRAGRRFEEKHSPNPRIANLAIDVRAGAGHAGVRAEDGIMSFNKTQLESFANYVLQKASGEYLRIEEREGSDNSPAASVEAVLFSRLSGLMRTLLSIGKTHVRTPSAEQRDALARHLWTFDQQRAHDGAVLGKWEHVSSHYRKQLQDQAEILLKLFFAVDGVVPTDRLAHPETEAGM